MVHSSLHTGCTNIGYWPYIMSDISYTVTFTGSSTPLQFTMTTCNSTNYCTLRVLGSELSPSDTYTVSVVASNIVGSGTAAVFPYTG